MASASPMSDNFPLEFTAKVLDELGDIKSNQARLSTDMEWVKETLDDVRDNVRETNGRVTELEKNEQVEAGIKKFVNGPIGFFAAISVVVIGGIVLNLFPL